MVDPKNHKFIGLAIILVIFFIVIVFADYIAPTISSTPVRFDIIEPNVNVDLP